MVQMRVITKTSGLDQVIRELPEQMAEIKRSVMEQMAADIALNSPVDSGEYVTNHQVRLRSGSFTPNKMRPDNLPRRSKGDTVDVSAKQQQGYENMLADIAAIDLSSNNFVFRNPMLYARIIEGEYGVYAQARKKAAQAVQKAVQQQARRGR